MNRPSLETRHLQLLVTLEAVGSLNAAARQLHLTPSALSQQLRDLESRLGGPLLHRGWRRMVMTAAGRRLTETARSVLGELARAEADAKSLLQGSQGVVRIATACYLSFRWFPSLLTHIAGNHPGLEVTVVSEASEAPGEWLLERRIDVALVNESAPRHRLLRLEPLFRDEIVALVGRGHPWFGRRSVEPEEFATEHFWGHSYVLRPDMPLGRALARAGNVSPRKFTPVPMIAGIPLEMARANAGVTVAALWAIEPALAEGDLQALRIGKRGLWLEWLVATRNEEPEPAVASVVAAMRERHPRALPAPSRPARRAASR